MPTFLMRAAHGLSSMRFARAFPLVLFTYLGVNYLLVGLHSYAG